MLIVQRIILKYLPPWGPVEKPKGLWTICIHPNTASDQLIDQLRQFLQKHAAQFTTVDRVLAEFDASEVEVAELAYEKLALWWTIFVRYKKQRMLQRHKAKDTGLASESSCRLHCVRLPFPLK